MTRAVIFVFKCAKGHTVEKSESEAESFNGSACSVCYRPMLVSGVKA